MQFEFKVDFEVDFKLKVGTKVEFGNHNAFDLQVHFTVVLYSLQHVLGFTSFYSEVG